MGIKTINRELKLNYQHAKILPFIVYSKFSLFSDFFKNTIP